MSDLIDRQEALEAIKSSELGMEYEAIEQLPSAQPPLEEFEWCTDCKEYDQKNHCCHRFTKVIRETVEELKSQPQRGNGNWICIDGINYECDQCGCVLEDWIQGAFYNYCPNCGADMRGEQDE